MGTFKEQGLLFEEKPVMIRVYLYLIQVQDGRWVDAPGWYKNDDHFEKLNPEHPKYRKTSKWLKVTNI